MLWIIITKLDTRRIYIINKQIDSLYFAVRFRIPHGYYMILKSQFVLSTVFVVLLFFFFH